MVEMTAVPRQWSMASSGLWVLQEYQDHEPVVSMMLKTDGTVGQFLGQSQPVQQPQLMSSSGSSTLAMTPATTTTGGSSMTPAFGGQYTEEDLAVDVFTDPEIHLALHCPMSYRPIGILLPITATMVGVVIGRPIRPNVALWGVVLDDCTVEWAPISRDTIMNMRRAEPHVDYLYIGPPSKNGDDGGENQSRLDEIMEAATSEDHGLPKLNVIIIRSAKELIDPKNKPIIYGERWPRRHVGEDRRRVVAGEGTTSGLEEGQDVDGAVLGDMQALGVSMRFLAGGFNRVLTGARGMVSAAVKGIIGS